MYDVARKDLSKEEVILHMDGDAFFVGVEVAKDASLRGKPVVTGAERGIVSALSYEAKSLGVTRGMPIFRVKKLFPQVMVLPGDYKSYAHYSQAMFDIVRRYADDVEEYSIDECFALLTGFDKPLKMSYRTIAERIKQEISDELSLSVTIGLAPTKVLAKVASKWVKPNGLTVITRDTIGEFLATTKIGSVWGIGPRTGDALEKKGIHTAQEFIAMPHTWVHENFSKPYEVIWCELQGVSKMAIDSSIKTSYSSIQRTRTFHPSTGDTTFLFSQLSKNLEEACTKARHYELTPRKVSIYLKDTEFEILSYTIMLQSPTNTPEVLLSAIHEHFERVYKKGRLYRATGITLCDLAPYAAYQDDLFGSSDRARAWEAIHKQLDTLECKFGKKVVHLASTQAALDRHTEGTEVEDLERNLLFL